MTAIPLSPRLSTHASKACATVQYADTTLEPAREAASATSCTSAPLDSVHSADATPNTKDTLTSSATATAMDV